MRKNANKKNTVYIFLGLTDLLKAKTFAPFVMLGEEKILEDNCFVLKAGKTRTAKFIKKLSVMKLPLVLEHKGKCCLYANTRIHRNGCNIVVTYSAL